MNPMLHSCLIALLLFSNLASELSGMGGRGGRNPSTSDKSDKTGSYLNADPAQCAGICRSQSVAGKSFLFGVINNDGHHYADEWSRGIRATTFEFQWQLYEPQEGIYDQSYINHMKDILNQLRAGGWYVQMIPGIQYTPQWVYDNYPESYYVNQYGERYNPSPSSQGSFRVINAPFNPQARNLISGYLARIFQDFNQGDPSLRFDSARVGGGVQGELRYPPANWNGHTNAFWAFDIQAQNPQVSGIPLEAAGWRPGIDPNPGSVGAEQLLVNPDFEDNRQYYPTFGWSPDPQVRAEFTTLDPQHGDQALELVTLDNHRIHQFVSVKPNTAYEFSVYLKSTNSSNHARMIITQYNANSQPVPGASFAKLESNSLSWVEQSGTLTSASGTKFFKVELDGDQPGTYYFDHLTLFKQGDPVASSRSIAVPVAFYDWYVQALTDYQNWQIDELRKFFSGQLDVLYAGKGVLTNQVMDALNNDLAGNGWSEANSGLYEGAVYERHVDQLATRDGIAVFVTGIDDPPEDKANDFSPYPNDWSAARWLAFLARKNNLPVWGENSGQDDAQKMALAVERMRQNNFIGLMWGFEYELYANPNSNGYASIEDYGQLIKTYGKMYALYLPVCGR